MTCYLREIKFTMLRPISTRTDFLFGEALELRRPDERKETSL